MTKAATTALVSAALGTPAVDTPEVAEVRDTTELEVSISKFEARIFAGKHIDGRDLAINYFFPLLKKLAKESGDQEKQIEELFTAVEDLDSAGSDDLETLESARDMILKLSLLLDQTMVHAGFYRVSKAGMKATDKIPAELRAAYEQIGGEVREVVADVQDAIQSYAEEEDDGLQDEGDDPETVKGAAAVASAAVAVAVADVVAARGVEPVEVTTGINAGIRGLAVEPTKSAKSAEPTKSAESRGDTDAA